MTRLRRRPQVLHPIGASGLRMLFECWLQLRGEAAKRQIASVGRGRKLALTHNLGGAPGRRLGPFEELEPGALDDTAAELAATIIRKGVLTRKCLALGLPVYASSQHGGIIWRRLKPEREHVSSMQFQTFDAGRISIAELVRASAAFPGIPPRRLRLPHDPHIECVAEWLTEETTRRVCMLTPLWIAASNRRIVWQTRISMGAP